MAFTLLHDCLKSDFYKRILQTGWLTNNSNLCLRVWETRISKVKALPGSVAGERALWFIDSHSLFMSSHDGRS